MGNYHELKKFIQHTLGCGCPEDVFKKIDYEKNQSDVWDGRINVGDRLLVYIVNVDSEDDVSKTIIQAMESGVTERNDKNFNRFRLVLVASNRECISSSAQKTFCASNLFDEKTHLHLLSENDIQAID